MPSRRPSRTEAGLRCNSCWMRTALCVCAEIPALKTDVRLVLLIHSHELKSTTNTGRLAVRAFANAEIRVRGRHGSPMNNEGLVAAGHQGLFLYPSEDAIELSHDYIRSLRGPFSLIVPDGTWRQASKVARREPGLANIQRVKLPEGKPSEYLLRLAPSLHSLSTIEAIARAMGFLEGPETQAQLEKLFRTVVKRTLWSRGALKTAQCREFLPEGLT